MRYIYSTLDLYENEAIALIKGLPENEFFCKRIGLAPNVPVPQIVKLYKVFIVENDANKSPRCIFISADYLSSKQFFYIEAITNKKDSQNLVLYKYTHPSVTGFLHDFDKISDRENEFFKWKNEHPHINAIYFRTLLDHTFRRGLHSSVARR